jgi:hypothetical protein
MITLIPCVARQGMNFDVGYANKGFVTDEPRNLVELDKPYILVTNHEINNIRVRAKTTVEFVICPMVIILGCVRTTVERPPLRCAPILPAKWWGRAPFERFRDDVCW